MRIKNLTPNLVIYFFLFFLLLCSLYLISYKIFNSYFTEIESSQNSKAVEHFTKKLNQEIKQVNNIATDYAHWDNTYDYMAGLNDEYIYNNFRDGTSTLEDLELDFIIFANKKNKIFYSKYIDNFKTNEYKFEKKVFSTLTAYNDSTSIIDVDKNHFIVIKKSIFESDTGGESNGFLYIGMKIDKTILYKFSSSFQNIHIIHKRVINPESIQSYQFIKDIHFSKIYKATAITNYLEIKDINGNYLFTIELLYNRDIVSNGKEVLILFNLIITLLLIFMFYLMVKHQRALLKQNFELDKEVIKKTFTLNKTLKQLKKKNKELFTLAHMDTLTKIHNRRSFFSLSSKAIDSCKKENKELCILMIDIDKFKNINDIYGHKTGDLVLKDFAQKVNSIIDKEAIFGRLGGEEFAITFENKKIEEIEKIAEQIRETLEKSIIKTQNFDIKYTASFGLSSYDMNDSIDDILSHADELLYKAKKGGRNRVVRSRL